MRCVEPGPGWRRRAEAEGFTYRHGVLRRLDICGPPHVATHHHNTTDCNYEQCMPPVSPAFNTIVAGRRACSHDVRTRLPSCLVSP